MVCDPTYRTSSQNRWPANPQWYVVYVIFMSLIEVLFAKFWEQLGEISYRPANVICVILLLGSPWGNFEERKCECWDDWDNGISSSLRTVKDNCTGRGKPCGTPGFLFVWWWSAHLCQGTECQATSTGFRNGGWKTGQAPASGRRLACKNVPFWGRKICS